MAGQLVPGVAEVRMQYSSDTEKCENVFHVEHGASSWSEADLEALATVFLTWEDTVAKLARNNSTSLVQIVATDLTSLAGFRFILAPDIPIVGTLGGDSSPNNVTIAIHADIGTRGRGKSGRAFWIGIAENQTDKDRISTAAGGIVEDAMNNLRFHVEGHDPAWFMCVPHRVVGGVRPPTVSYTNIRGWNLVDFTLDSMKLRLPGHKKHKKPSRIA